MEIGVKKSLANIESQSLTQVSQSNPQTASVISSKNQNKKSSSKGCWIGGCIVGVFLLLMLIGVIFIFNWAYIKTHFISSKTDNSEDLNEPIDNYQNEENNPNFSETAKTINQKAINLLPVTFGYCKALAPSDWTYISNKEATGADLFSADQTLHAGWGITGVYTSMYPTEEEFLQAWLSYAFTGSFTNAITLEAEKGLTEGFIQRDFTTNTNRRGMIIYKTYLNADPSFYVVSVYMADAQVDFWNEKGALPFSVALSIRCVSQLRPSTESIDYSHSDSSNADDNPEVSLSEKWTEAIMGYENVYSPSTGEHYEAPLNSKWEGGPDGSGYYRELPDGGYEKLENGFGDY